MRILVRLIALFTLSTHLFAAQEVKDHYPFFRQFRSGFNITFGAVSMVKSLQVLNSSDSTNTEKNYAYFLTAIGSLRLADGFYYLFNRSLPEIYLEDGKLDETQQSFQSSLDAARLFEKKLRRYRATVIFLNGLGFLSLYNEDPQKNQLSLWPGLGMMLVSTYAFWAKGPAEKSYDRIFPQLSLDALKVNDKFVFYPSFNFSF